MLCGLLAFFVAAAVAAQLLRCTDCAGQSVSTHGVPLTTTTTEAVALQAPPVDFEDPDDLAVAATITSTTEAVTTSSTEATNDSSSSTEATGDSSVSDTDDPVTETAEGAEGIEGENSQVRGTALEEPTAAAGRATASDEQPATEVYVDPENGSDTNTGATAERALKSLQTALNGARPGQSILLMSGTYDELRSPGETHYYLGRSGQPDAWIRISAAPGQTPKLVASRGTGLHVQGNYVEVSGLTIQGSGFNADNSWGVGISCPGMHHVRFVGNYVADMGASGISLNGCSNFQVVGNTVVRNAFWSDVAGSGISVFQSKNMGFGPDVGKYHNLVVGNRVFQNANKVPSKWQNHQVITDGNGIIIDEMNEHGYQGWTLIANNLAVGNGARGIQVWESANVDVLFNTAYGNGAAPIKGGRNEYMVGRSSNVRLAHNVGWAGDGLVALHNRSSNVNVVSDGNYLIGSTPSPTASAQDIQMKPSDAAGLMVAPSTDLGAADFRPVSGGSLDGKAGDNATGRLASDIAGTARTNPASPGAFDVVAARGR
jgi:hypothetical protein